MAKLRQRVHLPGSRGRVPFALAILLVTGLLLATLGVTPGAEATVNPGSISGVVTDETGAPVEGIVVSAFRNSSAATYGVVGQDETDATGVFQIDDLEAYPYHHVEFRDPTATYATEWYPDALAGAGHWVPVTAYTVTQGVDATLELAATLSGRVTSATGAPKEGHDVSLMSLGGVGAGPHVVTDAAGNYTLDRIKPGTYVVMFGDPMYGYPEMEYWDDKPNSSSAHQFVLAGGDAVTGIDAVIDKPVRNVVAPSIGGTPQVGKTLTASPGTWEPAGVTITYRWVVGTDNVTSDDPTGPTYVPTPADVGQTIRVYVIGTYPGWPPVAASSSPTGLVVAVPVTTPPRPADAITYVVRPRVKGTLRVGEVVRVSKGVWKPSAVTFRYQWFAGGKSITDATHRRLTLSATYVGKRLTVRIKAKAAGYPHVIVWTKPTTRIKP